MCVMAEEEGKIMYNYDSTNLVEDVYIEST
jgi:hypothetical protein